MDNFSHLHVKSSPSSIWHFPAGVMLLDIEASSFHGVVNRLIEEFAAKFDLTDELRSELLRSLLAPHKYVDGHTSMSREFNRSFRDQSYSTVLPQLEGGPSKTIASICLLSLGLFRPLFGFIFFSEQLSGLELMTVPLR